MTSVFYISIRIEDKLYIFGKQTSLILSLKQRNVYLKGAAIEPIHTLFRYVTPVIVTPVTNVFVTGETLFATGETKAIYLTF